LKRDHLSRSGVIDALLRHYLFDVLAPLREDFDLLPAVALKFPRPVRGDYFDAIAKAPDLLCNF
jgi:hypothetical protein